MIDIDPPMLEEPPTITVVEMVRRAAAKDPEAEALICGADRLCWKQLDARINRVANALLARGLQKGDRVAVLSQRKVLVADTLEAVAATEDGWIQDYFHGPRGRAASYAFRDHSNTRTQEQ